MFGKWHLYIIPACLLAFHVSCTWSDPKPSILVIAVDSLSFDTVKCGDVEKNKGFKVICDEMIRFTHTYTPSILTQASLTSLLTGKYPFEHGVWNNGGTFLSAKHQTSAEVAFQKGYKTLFVSGGAPIWRKSGLDQGFEVFEDSISIDYQKYYRDVFTNSNIFLDWLKDEAQDSSYFSFLFVNDLQFSDFPTVDNEGYLREKTNDGQLREIDESLGYLFGELKNLKKWNSTWVFVVGTNGLHKDLRSSDSIGTNLFHENTNVAFFIKPPSQEEHPKGVRTIDLNINLVDIGRLLFEILDSEFYETSKTFFKTISLKKVIFENAGEMQDRILLFESGWPQWRGIGQTKFALQKENYLLIYNQPPLLFNTLVDRNQIYPLDYNQTSNSFLSSNATQLIAFLNNSNKYVIQENAIQKYRLASLFFKKDEWNKDYLSEVENFFEKYKDIEVAGWLANYFIDQKKWDELLKIGNQIGNTDWSWLASQYLKLVPKDPNICIQLILNYKQVTSESSFLSRCEDERLLALFGYLKYREKIDKKEILFKTYKTYRLEEDLQRLNYQNGFIWDTKIDLVEKPSNIRIILESPQYAKLKKILDVSL